MREILNWSFVWAGRRQWPQVSQKQFKESRAGREQQLKETRKTKQSNGHLVCLNPLNKLQLDTYVAYVLQKMKVLLLVLPIYYVSWVYIAKKYGVTQWKLKSQWCDSSQLNILKWIWSTVI